MTALVTLWAVVLKTIVIEGEVQLTFRNMYYFIWQIFIEICYVTASGNEDTAVKKNRQYPCSHGVYSLKKDRGTFKYISNQGSASW